MPITAVYIILTATLAQPLISMGAELIAAHMFIFMFSVVAGLTPPVAITSYTAAGIAQTDPNEVAVHGFLYGLPGYIIPFVSAISPALLMVGTAGEIITATLTALVGIVCLVAAIEGYFIYSWPIPCRMLLFITAFMFIMPGLVTDLTGVGIIAVSLIIRLAFKGKTKPRATVA